MTATEPAFRGRAPGRTVAQSLRSLGARKWMAGGAVGVLWLVGTQIDIHNHDLEPASRILSAVLLTLFGASYLIVPPINWALPPRFGLVLPIALLGFSFTLYPWLGPTVYTLWMFPAIAAAMSMLSLRVMLPFVLCLAIGTVGLELAAGLVGEQLFPYPALLVSISLMMASFARVLVSRNQLIATQHELARLAVEKERSRVARDMHDILGHSLTVITVKAELAGRLIETDPGRAAREIADLEQLARGALADVRTTVAGVRGVSLSSELANARSALEAAGITAHVPGTVEVVPSSHRELFAWATREGVTNVIRHSHASRCDILIAPDFIEVSDDGRSAGETSDGSGLDGLRERAAALGATVTAGPRAAGGFALRVSA